MKTGQVFRFRQFDVEQPDDGLKITTDGVLLGALAHHHAPRRILDIGTGSGVIALMLAQRFAGSPVDAVDIDPKAANLAGANFHRSPFASRLQSYSTSFQQFLTPDRRGTYDLIVSNPPYFIDALRSPRENINRAKHAPREFFNELVSCSAAALSATGVLCLILPEAAAQYVVQLAAGSGLHPGGEWLIRSFSDKPPVRYIVTLSRNPPEAARNELVIYEQDRSYTAAYQNLLSGFLTIFP